MSLKLTDLLIEVSDDDNNDDNNNDNNDDNNDNNDDNNDDNDNNNIDNIDENNNSDNSDDSENNNLTKSIYLIHNNQTISEDPIISDFIKFCKRDGLFDNTFYDYNNTYSVVATKLPITFGKISSDGSDVNRKTFINKFKKEFGYNGDINFIYNCIDSQKKGFVTWDDFLDFFLPFIEYVTVS